MDVPNQAPPEWVNLDFYTHTHAHTYTKQQHCNGHGIQSSIHLGDITFFLVVEKFAFVVLRLFEMKMEEGKMHLRLIH